MEAVMTTPQMRVDALELDPTLEAGSTHTARATLTNPTAKEFTYAVELYFGVTKVVTSGVGEVTIPAGQSVEVSFTVTMPLIEADYQPYIDAYVGAELVAHYVATELVTIVVTPAIIIGPIIWV